MRVDVGYVPCDAHIDAGEVANMVVRKGGKDIPHQTGRRRPPKDPKSSQTPKMPKRIPRVPTLRELRPITAAQVRADKSLKPRAKAAILKALEQRKIDEG